MRKHMAEESMNRKNMKRLIPNLVGQKGFTIVELLIAAFLMSVITLAVFQFYAREHQVYSVQDEIANAQQNVRFASDELAANVMVGGADIPGGLAPVISFDTNPDTIVIRYNKTGCRIGVKSNTAVSSANPILTSDSVTCLTPYIGQLVYLVHNDTSPGEPAGEWFVLSSVVFNGGTGWQELSHPANFLGQPKVGDEVLVMEEVKYFIDNITDAAHPKLMKMRNGQAAEVYAEDITDLQFTYILGGGAPDTVADFVAAGRDARDIENVQITVQSRTFKRDPKWPTDGGFRLRTLTSEVHLRNLNLL